MSHDVSNDAWDGPGVRRRKWRHWFRELIWFLIFPQKRQRDLPTVSGVLLVVLALGMGLAAYNTGNNILFIALALLLACLILSGVLAWMNFGGLRWRLRVASGWRAGVGQVVALELANAKKWLPSYGLWFEWCAQPQAVRDQPAEAIKGVINLSGRLEPKGEKLLEWSVKPTRRGRWHVRMDGVGSFFPFGFFKKSRLTQNTCRTVIVWPAVIEYQRHALAIWARQALGRPQARSGMGMELHALRPYRGGDSHRMIHWKATARAGRIMVREAAAEAEEGCRLRLETSALLWTKPEEFDLACELAATLAEDLFRAKKLAAVALNDAPWIVLKRTRDLDLFFDQLALAEPSASGVSATRGSGGNVITFGPSGGGRVTAYLDGQPAATA